MKASTPRRSEEHLRRSGLPWVVLASGFSLTLSDGATASAAHRFTVAVPARHVYWTDRGSDTIGRADPGGQNANQSFITGAHFPVGMAVDSGHVYWANDGTGTIGRADVDGQNANHSFIGGATFSLAVAVDPEPPAPPPRPAEEGRARAAHRPRDASGRGAVRAGRPGAPAAAAAAS